MAKVDDGTSIVKMVDWTFDVETYGADRMEMMMQEFKDAETQLRNDYMLSHADRFKEDLENPFRKGAFHEALQKQTATCNPLLEIVESFIEATAFRNCFSWMYGDLDYKDRCDPLGVANVARLEGRVHKERGPDKSNSSFSYGYFAAQTLGVTISFDLYNHNNLNALLCSHMWRFSHKTCEFIEYIMPLVKEMGRDEKVRVSFEYTEHSSPLKYTDGSRTNFELYEVVFVVGDLVLRSNFRFMEDFEEKCKRINHSTILICNRKMKNILRPAYFVCNNDEVMFYFDYDKGLKNILTGSIPTETEMLLIDMAGHKKEFWLDDIKSFNPVEIKPFDLEEATKWHRQQLPIYRL